MSTRDHPLALYDLPLLYDLIVRPGPCEAFYRKLASCTGGPVLELACGTGRLTVPLALVGHDVVGLDVHNRCSALRAPRPRSKALR
jgi:2-polyprenyl-3-methyl-5-hydroxy-6-metoxy-1,4-benzoquinol methylase